MKNTTPFNQVIVCKSSDRQKIFQLWQMVLRKGRRACQFFCSSLEMCGPLLYQRFTCCPAQTDQLREDKVAQAGLRPPAATTLIINISNSTLIDCIIGNDSYPSAVVENQPLMQGSELQMHERMRCNCSCGQQGAAQTAAAPPPPSEEHQSIHIHGSHLNCVIIGDNNSMQVEQTHCAETEPQV
ncbi:uncharacterized protein LOC139914229 [Centroberyx gerrardi]